MEKNILKDFQIELSNQLNKKKKFQLLSNINLISNKRLQKNVHPIIIKNEEIFMKYEPQKKSRLFTNSNLLEMKFKFKKN